MNLPSFGGLQSETEMNTSIEFGTRVILNGYVIWCDIVLNIGLWYNPSVLLLQGRGGGRGGTGLGGRAGRSLEFKASLFLNPTPRTVGT